MELLSSGYYFSANVFQLPTSGKEELTTADTGRFWLLVTKSLTLISLCTCSCFPSLGYRNEIATARHLPVCNVITPLLFYSYSASPWINEVLTWYWTWSSSSFHPPAVIPHRPSAPLPVESPVRSLIASLAGKMDKLLNSSSERCICKLHHSFSPPPFFPSKYFYAPLMQFQTLNDNLSC